MILSAAAALAIANHQQDPMASTTAKPAIEIKLAKDVQYYKPLAMAPSATGHQVAMTLDDNSVRIIDAATHGTLKTFTGHPQQPFAIAWSADGAWIATGDESARMFLWDARTGQQIRAFPGHIKGIQNISFNLPRTMMISTGKDDAIKMWDPLTGKCTKTILGAGANLYSGTFSPVTNSFACGT